MQTNGKVKRLEELSRELSGHRSKNKKVVLCHGVFDLLHLGHIRYLKQAKQLGDILVVTLTPDRFVNKGPHRPAFNEQLRAETLAALDCVDYVAINQWPMAVETIRLLKPNLYVKGAEYQDPEKDCTDGIRLEEKAIRSVGGELVLVEDLTFSSSHLIKQFLPVFSKEVSDYLISFSERYRSDDVIRYLQAASELKVLVVGEAIIDEYHYCETIGKSSKEPILALKHFSLERFAGGTLAMANHAANFSNHVGLITLLGARNSEEDFIKKNLNPKIKTVFLTKADSPTIVKKRFIDNYFFSKMLELYEMNDDPLKPNENQNLCEKLEKELPKYDVVIVTDFGHGMITKEAVKVLTTQAKFLAVNAQSNAGNLGFHAISKYPRADYICLAEGEARLEARDRRGDLKEIVLELSKRLSCKKIMVTRGKVGCLSFSRKEGFFEVPALAGEVVDRMGAGDAFLSLTAPVVAQGAPMEIAGFIGNAVGAQAVATVGHRSAIERIPLYKQIESLMK